MTIVVRGQRVIPPAERIEALSIPEPNTGCWIWLGGTDGSDKPVQYGRLCVGSRSEGRRSVSAHRYSYEVFKGPVPEGLHVCHRCDNPACVNPEHLYAGTRAQNTDDRQARGRNRPPKGSASPHAKISESDVLAILASTEGAGTLGRRYGIAKKTIQRIRAGTAWTHVPRPQTEGSAR